jgi:topoisomerase-4 subunit A
MYKTWFLDYASYVILERAVPHVNDGLKPVQRRILHAMKRLDDGRFNKVANIIGFTMQYHPHGDASIGDAIVQIGQKDLMIETQGNWGNIYTGDNAAASRYIEARLSKFALEVGFNAKTTKWKQSYDGRNKEPFHLPMKFPLLLAQGVEGIAVGLASKILPHNFIELIDASINYLQDKPFELFPDFPTGGMIDVLKYNDGIRGGKVRVRAKIDKDDKKTLIITDLPFGKTTTSLIESIIVANDKGKIKIRKIEDKTASVVKILVHLMPGISPDQTIDALYAFTDCEVSISPNTCIIEDDKPKFIGVSEILRIVTDRTLELLKEELLIRKEELNEAWHFSSLEKIFIENRIYNLIEECETWEEIIGTIDNGLKPFKSLFRREISQDDITKLTEIKIKRISRFDGFKADEYLKSIEEEMKQIDYDLAHIVDFTIAYYKRIKDKYSEGRERKTEIRYFDNIIASEVVVANEKLYVNWAEGFAGIGLKKDEFICDCSDIDDIIVFRNDGTYYITKVVDKFFIGTNAIHVNVFRKNDERTIYNVVYRDGKTLMAYIKRFYVNGVTRDKEYKLTTEHKFSEILYFSANPNGEAESINVKLKPKPRLKIRAFDYNFSEIAIKNRNSLGNILSRNPVHKIIMKEKGDSTLGGMKIWFDDSVYRLNSDGRGLYIGEFKGDDKILVVRKSGFFRISSFELTNHYNDDIVLIEKFNPGKVFNVMFFDGEQKLPYLKRFVFEDFESDQSFIGEEKDSYFITISGVENPLVELKFGGKYKNRTPEVFTADEFIKVKGFRARGKRLSNYDIAEMRFIEPEIAEIQEIKFDEKIHTSDEEKQGNLFDDPEFEIIRPKGD